MLRRTNSQALIHPLHGFKYRLWPLTPNPAPIFSRGAPPCKHLPTDWGVWRNLKQAR